MYDIHVTYIYQEIKLQWNLQNVMMDYELAFRISLYMYFY